MLISPQACEAVPEGQACPFWRCGRSPHYATGPKERLQAELDPGESAAIALALEIGADLILADERKGRKKAQAMGLSVVGLLGVLSEAKREGLIPACMPLLDALERDARFWCLDSIARPFPRSRRRIAGRHKKPNPLKNIFQPTAEVALGLRPHVPGKPFADSCPVGIGDAEPFQFRRLSDPFSCAGQMGIDFRYPKRRCINRRH
jgi:hypothetical protein